jgi:hypothetical protein
MTRIWLARLSLFIRVIRAIRCFWFRCLLGRRRWRFVRNEANLGRVSSLRFEVSSEQGRPATSEDARPTRGPCAKRTQLGRVAGWKWQVAREQSAAASSVLLPASGRGCRAKRSQFPPECRSGDRRSRGESCETNPIGRVRRWLLTVGWNKA